MSSARPTPEATPDDESPAERKGARTRRRILEAARGVFADVGYERATIRLIAAAAGVDKSSVIQYFGTKQGLFREAVHWDIPTAELAGRKRRADRRRITSAACSPHGRPIRTVRWRCCCGQA